MFNICVDHRQLRNAVKMVESGENKDGEEEGKGGNGKKKVNNVKADLSKLALFMGKMRSRSEDGDDVGGIEDKGLMDEITEFERQRQKKIFDRILDYQNNILY